MLTSQTLAADFPSLHGRAYLNTAAEGIPPLAVHEALEDYWRDKSLGMKGRDSHFGRLESCREVTARLLGRPAKEVAFCSCASEAYNLLASSLAFQDGEEVVISDLDFPAGATPWFRLVRPPDVRLWSHRKGVLEMQDLEVILGPKTRLVQVSLVSFLTGYRIPWQALEQRVRALAPQAVLAVDVTQALGRVPLTSLNADVIISSTYKWQLGVHGGGAVAVSEERAEQITSRAGGWFHLSNAFDADRFQRAVPFPGARSFSVGMPSFPAVYALEAGLSYLEEQGVEAVADHADGLVARLHQGLAEIGLETMSPYQPEEGAGIISFLHPRDAEIHATLEAQDIHVMHQAGRLRVSVHGYNTESDVDRFLEAVRPFAV